MQKELERYSMLIASAALLVAAATWLFPNPFGVVSPRVFFSASPRYLIQYEIEFGSLYTPLPYCFRKIDTVSQGDNYFRTYYLWQYARATPAHSWTFYQREVRLKRVDIANAPLWQIIDSSEWKETEVMYYFGDIPKHKLLLTTSEYSNLKSNCGDSVISSPDFVLAMEFDYSLYELISRRFSVLDLTPFENVNFMLRWVAILLSGISLSYISIEIPILFYICLRKTINKNYTYFGNVWFGSMRFALAEFLLSLALGVVGLLDAWRWLVSQF